MKSNHPNLFLAVLTWEACLTACDNQRPFKHPTPKPTNGTPSALSGETPGTELDGAYFDGLVSWSLERGTEKVQSLAAKKQALLVSFDGTSIKSGNAPGKSGLICGKQPVLATGTVTAPDQTTIMAAIKDYFEKEKLNIQVLSKATEAKEEDTTVVLIADSYASLGCESKLTPAYVAPLDTDNLNPFDVAFVFLDQSKTQAQLIESIVASASRSFGADPANQSPGAWEQLVKNLGEMPSEEKEGAKESTEELPTVNPGYENPTTPAAATPLSMGKYGNELAGLSGIDFLSAIGSSLPEVSAENAIDTALIDELIKKSLPEKVTFPGLNRVVTIMEISKLAAKKKMAADNLPTDNDKVQAASKGLLKPSSLMAIGGMVAMAYMGGFGSIPAASNAAGQVYGNIQDELPPTVDPNTLTLPAQAKDLPNFADFLGITEITDLKSLLTNLRMHVYVINQNYSGDDRAAMISMVKVAYSQVYKKTVRPQLVKSDD
jgi:hypothetical protein